MLNRCEFIGRIGQQPSIAMSNSGTKIATLSMAITDKWKDKTSGEMKEKTEWVRLKAFGNLAEIVEKYVSKGKMIYAEGKMQTTKYTDNNGVEKYTTEVVMSNLDLLVREASSNEEGSHQEEHGSQDSENDSEEMVEDEIPF